MFVLSTAPTNCKLFKEINREKQDLDFKETIKCRRAHGCNWFSNF